jgi:hypothetical protein
VHRASKLVNHKVREKIIGVDQRKAWAIDQDPRISGVQISGEERGVVL